VAAPLLDSSSGWACTAINRNSLTCSLCHFWWSPGLTL
jgi:hypothetical protein